jgi:hypothetical protein
MTCDKSGMSFVSALLVVHRAPPRLLVALLLLHGGSGGGRHDLCPPGRESVLAVVLQVALLLALLEARSMAALESTGQELGIVFVDRVSAGTEQRHGGCSVALVCG